MDLYEGRILPSLRLVRPDFDFEKNSDPAGSLLEYVDSHNIVGVLPPKGIVTGKFTYSTEKDLFPARTLPRNCNQAPRSARS